MKKKIFKLAFITAFLFCSSQVFSQTIPDVPVGVTCPSNNSTFVFTAEFDDFDGWTGDLSTNNDFGSWVVPGGSFGSSTGTNAAFSGDNYMSYEASGPGATGSASVVSPAIDLIGATDGAELSFYMHAFGASMGTLQVGVSTSITGPFTNVFTYTGQLQTSQSDDWVPVGINLDAYLGSTIYLEFNQTGGGTFAGDMSIDLVRVETCGTFCLSPTVAIDNIVSGTSDVSVEVSWIANDTETSWEYLVLTAGSVIPDGNTMGISTTVTNFSQNGLSFGEDYDVYVRANCTNGNSLWAGPETFSTPLQTNYLIDCSAGGPVTHTICYGDNGDDIDEAVIYTFTSTDGTPLTLDFYSGYVENGYDPIIVIDSNGMDIVGLDNPVFGENGNIAGLSYTSSGDTISFYIYSDSFTPSSCANGDAPMNGGITYTVSCATCTNPEATFNVIDDCDNGDQFFIDVEVTSLGDATSLTLSNNINTDFTPITNIGTTYQIGPFPFFTDVVFYLSNDQDSNCVFTSLPTYLRGCIPDNDECVDAIMVPVNADDVCNQIVSATLLSSTASDSLPISCTFGDGLYPFNNNDVWFSFVAIDETQTIGFSNIVSEDGAPIIRHTVYEGSCNNLTELYCTRFPNSGTPQLIIGNTYYIRAFITGTIDFDVSFDLCITRGINDLIVDQTTYTTEQLVKNVLFGDDCVLVSDVTFSTGTNYDPSFPNGIGSFTMDGPEFPFSEGIVLSTGEALDAGGPNIGDGSAISGNNNWLGDQELDDLLGISSINASIIEFDYVPLSDQISFDFLMASTEYPSGGGGGLNACTHDDSFAFILTDSNGNSENIAVLPNGGGPISVTNIHPANLACGAVNEEYFDTYLVPNLPPIPFSGITQVFTAQSTVNIGEKYHIKLIVADGVSRQINTAIFIKPGDFDLGELDLGDDITIEAGTATCLSEPVVLNTLASDLEHVWYKDGFVIEGETSSTLIVTEPDFYTAQVVFSNDCILTSSILVEFLELPIANFAPDLVECSATNQAFFDLTENDEAILGDQNAADFTITYHSAEQDAVDGLSPLSSTYSNISSPQIIYARIEDNNTGCFATTTFFLTLSAPSHTAFSTDLIGCDFDNDGVASFDLESHNFEILNGQDASQYNVSYYTSESGAMSDTGALSGLYESSGETLYVRVESVDFSGCYVTNNFNLVIGIEPVTSFVSDVNFEVCPNASSPIDIEAIPGNYVLSEVSINWYRDGGIIAGENSLTLPVYEAGQYEIEVVFNDTGCIGYSEFTVIELATCVFPQGISPGVSPGQNDTFDLSSFDVTKLEIFNRYGALVYSKNNYTNEWHGQTNDGDELPVGTYFYTVVYEGGTKSKSNWVYINR